MRAPPRRTIRIMPSSTKLGRTDTAKEKAAGEHLKQQKRADDMAEKLKMSVHKARNLLTTTTAKLEEAVRKNMLLRTKEQSEAADRALLRAREWHRIHRKLNHPSKAVTDEDGRVTAWDAAFDLYPGSYQMEFLVGAYFARRGVPTFFESIPVRFVVEDIHRAFHVPLV